MGSETALTETRWTQPFRWGLLTAFDDERRASLPDDVTSKRVTATDTALTVLVRHSQDATSPQGWPDDLGQPEAQVQVIVAFNEAPVGSAVEFEGLLRCESGRLAVGDAETEQVLDVPAGVLRVQVSLFPVDFAENVVLRLLQTQ